MLDVTLVNYKQVVWVPVWGAQDVPVARMSKGPVAR